MGNVNTKEVLKVLGVGAIFASSLMFPNLPSAIVAAHKAWRNFNKADIGRIIKRLEKQQMISLRESKGQIQIEITEKGKRRLLEYDFENIQLRARKRDGKWRLIIFDIPEAQKSNRDVFRRKLLQLGFIRLQDSVFVSAFPCKNEIDFLCNFLEISDYVTLTTLDKIERGEQLIFKRISGEY